MQRSSPLIMSQYVLARMIMMVCAMLLVACGQSSPTAGLYSSPDAAENTFVPVLAVSELEVGQNRLPLGIIKNGTPVNDPDLKLHLRFYYLDGDDKTTVRSESDAVYRGQGLPVGIYVAYPQLDQAGAWSVEIEIPQTDGPPQTSRIRVDVLAESPIPSVGSPAPATRNLTARDRPDLTQLTSDSVPDPDLYQLTIAEAIAARKPFVVTFSTPGFCQTAVCAPNLQVIKQLKDQLQDELNFIHVEVYPYPFSESFQKQRMVPAMREWHLRTEPWTFLVDAEGIIQAKYEGGLTLVELEPALRQLADGQPVDPTQS